MLSENLKILLATSYAFVIKAQNFHWNVEGGDFFELHQEFENDYNSIKVIIDEMKTRLGTATSYMPGSIEFSKLVSQAQIPQALVSASPRELVDAVVGNLDQNYFKQTVAAGDIERTKPFPDPYLHAAKLLEVDISNCLIFEDSQTGITAATASGAFVVAIPHFIEVIESARLKRIESFVGLTQQDLNKWWEINQRELGR